MWFFWNISSSGQSTRLITERFGVRIPDVPFYSGFLVFSLEWASLCIKYKINVMVSLLCQLVEHMAVFHSVGGSNPSEGIVKQAIFLGRLFSILKNKPRKEIEYRHILESIRNLVAENSAAKFFRETTYKNRGKE